MTNSYDVSPSDAKRKVARGICIAKNSVNPEVANCLVFFPPRCELIKFNCADYNQNLMSFANYSICVALYPEQRTSVRVLQLSSNVGVCPSEM